MKHHRAARIVVCGMIVAGAVIMLAGAPADAERREWKGAETFAPVDIGPNPARCGPFPRHLEARFAGTGIDTHGGPFAVTVSGCLDTEANVLFDLEATDTYLRTGDSVNIAPADTSLDVDPATCVAATPRPIPYAVAGGTGAMAGSTGGGHYEMAFTLPTCAGPQQSVHVWFRGQINT